VLAKLLAALHNVEFREWIEDLDAFLSAAGAVLLLDETGSGIKNRALHAMALGATVIGTAAALEGIPVRPGSDAIICFTSDEFATAIGQVQRSGEKPSAMELAAAEFVCRHYSDSAITRQWAKLFQDAIEGRKG
jgi:glycosyltransferase involved in cell wall biosynthesis